MMWVRFPNGQCIRYNTANLAKRTLNGYTDLYTKKDGVWVAQVPTAMCVIESIQACAITNPLDKQPDTETAKELRAIKRKLSKLNAR